MCCSNHLTSFAVGEPFEVETGRYEKTLGSLVTINLFCVAFMILGFFLDKKKLLLFDRKAFSDKDTLPSAEGAAAVEQSSKTIELGHSALSGQIPNASISMTPAKESSAIGLEEVKVEVNEQE